MKQPLSYIHPNAIIAKNVVIEPFTSIDGDVEIGEGTWIGSNVSIMDGARIGKNCNIYPGAVISANPQDLKYCLLYTSPSPRDRTRSRMPSSA